MPRSSFSARLVFALAVAVAGCGQNHLDLGKRASTNIGEVAREKLGAFFGGRLAPPPGCPEGMVLAEGDYCTDVEQKCLEWMDPPGLYHEFRCARYEQPARCKGARVAMRFCVDRDEQGATPDDPRPSNHVSYVAAVDACAARGARLCTQSEWQFACEGPEMRPYPYGFVRDASACNIDREGLGTGPGGLQDLRSAVGDNPRCVSPFGVRDLAGNLEEWATRDVGTWSKETLLKGSWWLPGRSTCRATNAGHDQVYQGTETGYRCCQ